MKLWQKRITSLSDLPLGSKSAPFPPPSAMWLSYFLKVCSNAKILKYLNSEG
jgi:hypothetical protein